MGGENKCPALYVYLYMIPCVYIRVQDQAVNVKPQTIKYTRRHAKVLKNKASR